SRLSETLHRELETAELLLTDSDGPLCPRLVGPVDGVPRQRGVLVVNALAGSRHAKLEIVVVEGKQALVQASETQVQIAPNCKTWKGCREAEDVRERTWPGRDHL